MKKQLAAAVLSAVLAAAFVAQGTLTFAAPSITADDHTSDDIGTTTTDTTTTTGTTTTGESTVTTIGGAGGITVVSDGQVTGNNTAVVAETVNARGEIIQGDTAISVSKNEDLMTNVAAPLASAMQQINSGVTPAQALGSTAMQGYNALTTFSAVVVKDAATGQEKRENTTISVYVPNLTENLQNVSLLYLDFATGQFITIPLTSIDLANKTVSATIPGSGAFTVVYR